MTDLRTLWYLALIAMYASGIAIELYHREPYKALYWLGATILIVGVWKS